MMRVLALLALFLASLPAAAAELIMFDLRGCPYCARFKAEVAPGYPRSPEGQRAPLRIVDIKGGTPQGVTLRTPVIASPTFVLVDDGGGEVGRITGYPGADFFWGLFAEMVKRLPPKPAG